MLDRIEARYGVDPGLRKKLQPIVVRILQSGPRSPERTALLRLVIRTYARHVQIRDLLAKLADGLRERVNDAYGRMLGIEPPGI